ncbi:DegT/DnrJ/EryC1/StrS family aminotransferase [Sporosarcina sp. G11-34]|uniref:DegT/DnrJ/EryC1/StrS family aminotransferase n=1 Tax=Sporosarcina sp. G11-34 TaxID=2849605 RepID=UPI0022A9D05F|nr:DegT/DnrJ/EryC1/StrS family aminotransferase [Sporosarcina sp. G11-34]MCZ2258632.1 hypothetical protein [Sporosarcina sp. G11-34]
MEIGSEFHISHNKILYSEVFIYKDKDILLNYGRTAIKFLLENLQDLEHIRGVLLPNYLCESIIQPLKEINIPYEFYKIDKDFKVIINDMESKLKPGWAVFVLDYFNVRQEKELLNYINNIRDTNIIIEDITHSLFDIKESIGHFQIASIRKWLGLPSGALIRDFYNGKMHNLVIPETSNINSELVQKRFYAAILKSLYLKEQGNEHVKSEYLNLFNEAEMILDKSNIEASKIDSISKEIISHYNFESMLEVRKENYKILYTGLKELQAVEVINGRPDDNKVPLGFPIKVHDRDSLRNSLIQANIYPPIHWPLPEELLYEPTDAILNISRSILTLPCDQRYTEKDMNRMIKVIKNHYWS